MTMYHRVRDYNYTQNFFFQFCLRKTDNFLKIPKDLYRVGFEDRRGLKHEMFRTNALVEVYQPRGLHLPKHGRGYGVALHGNPCGRERTMNGAVTVGGSFLEKFTFPLRIKCPGTTLSAAFNEKMTPEQYLHN